MARFILGFKTLADLIPDVVGEPIEDEKHDAPRGDSLQQTTTGLMVWRKTDNWTAFTDGYRTWINGPNGLETRLNTEQLPWERTQRKPELEIIAQQLPIALWNQLTLRNDWEIKLLVVHWDGGAPFRPDYEPFAYYQWEARYHIAKDWGNDSHGYGLMYHECIDRSGRVWLTRPSIHVVWAQGGANRISYAIKVDATEESPPTEPQMVSLTMRLDKLRQEYNLKRMATVGHGELLLFGNTTSCPGSDLLKFVEEYRESTAP